MSEEEYTEFYKSISRDFEEPMTKIHFTAEGEVTFKSILYVPKHSPNDMFSNYGKKVDHIKLYVRRVFITDDFEDMMPKYLTFIRGIVSIFLLNIITSIFILRNNKRICTDFQSCCKFFCQSVFFFPPRNAQKEKNCYSSLSSDLLMTLIQWSLFSRLIVMICLWMCPVRHCSRTSC